MRLKYLAGPKTGGAWSHSPPRLLGWSRTAALWAFAIVALLAGCASSSTPTSAASGNGSKSGGSTTTTAHTVASSILIPVPDGALQGYVHTEGTWAIKPQFELAGNFSEGLAPVYVNGKWGYINQAGQFAIKPQYYEAHSFQNGLALVATKPQDWLNMYGRPLGTGYGWIDKTGKSSSLRLGTWQTVSPRDLPWSRSGLPRTRRGPSAS